MADYKEFSKQIKEKYPQYKDVDDLKLAKAMLEKYPQYAQKVTFDETKPIRPRGRNGIDLTPSGLVNNAAFGTSAALTAPFVAARDKIPFGQAFQNEFAKNQENYTKFKENSPTQRLADFTTDMAGYSALPVSRVAGWGGRALTGLGQGAIIGGLEGLKEGVNPLSTATSGGIIGAGLNVAVPGLGVATKKAGKVLPWVGNSLARNIGRLQPETLAQAVKPDSIALDLTPKQAQKLLTNTTDRVRNAYDNLLSERGKAISTAEDNLRNIEGRVNVDDVLGDIRGTFDKYQGDKINTARNLTGGLENDLNNLVESATTPAEDFYNYIQSSEKPNFYSKAKENEAFDILSKATGKSPDWLKSQLNSDKFRGSVGKRKEFIENLLDKTDDRLDLSKSSNINDYDYYYNGNLGYNNDDVSAGADLARQAYDDIINRNFQNVDIDPLSRSIYEAEHDYRVILRDLLENSRDPNTFGSAFEKLEKSLKNLPEEIQMEYANKFVTDSEKILQGRNTISPIDLQKIKQEIGQMTNWADTTRPKIQNTVLEQIYGKINSRLQDLSPELAQANKEFANLKAFQYNEGLKRILRPGDNVDSAATTLKNYDSAVTKGNQLKNIQELENTLVDAGEQPFLNTIDDINAAMDLNNIRTTGDSLWANIGTAMARPVLKGVRALNRRRLPKLGDKLKNTGRVLRPLAIKGSVPLLYGGISNDDEDY